MATTVRAVFDGEVLRPEQPINLRPNTTYLVTIEREEAPESGGEESVYPLTAITSLAADMGVSDLSTHHHRYAHGRATDNGGD